MLKLTIEQLVAIMGAIENGRAIDHEQSFAIYAVLLAARPGDTIEITADLELVA